MIVNYTVEKLSTQDFYDTMTEWWKGHNFPVVNYAMLPETTFVYYVEGVPVYSTCFYNTDSSICWLGWQISNPSVSKDTKEGGLEILFHHILDYAKELQYELVFTTSSTKPVEENLSKVGFRVGDTNVKHYIKILE